MSEQVDIKNVHREPHPFVAVPHIPSFVGKTIAFVGRVNAIEDGTMLMRTSDGKWLMLFWPLLETEVKVIRFKGDAEKFPVGNVVEVRGIVNKDNSISFGESSKYDNEFDLQAFEQMLDYYHGMCRELSCKWISNLLNLFLNRVLCRMR